MLFLKPLPHHVIGERRIIHMLGIFAYATVQDAPTGINSRIDDGITLPAILRLHVDRETA